MTRRRASEATRARMRQALGVGPPGDESAVPEPSPGNAQRTRVRRRPEDHFERRCLAEEADPLAPEPELTIGELARRFGRRAP